MLPLTPAQRYFLYRPPTDMRKSFNGLSGLVRQELKDPLSGDVFIFVNRRRDRIKLLVWDRSGFVLYYKQLQQGAFEVPDREELRWADLLLILEGIELQSVRHRKRFSLAPKPVAPEKSAAM
jgi:transposase